MNLIRRFAKTGFGALAALALVVGPATVAQATDVVIDDSRTSGIAIITEKGGNRSGGGVVSLFNVKGAGVDGSTVQAYCVELGRRARYDAPGVVTDWANYQGDNAFKHDPVVREKVGWIIQHSYPKVPAEEIAKAAGVDVNIFSKEQLESIVISGTQGAIWTLTDGVNFVGVSQREGGDPYNPKARTTGKVLGKEHPAQIATTQVVDYLKGPENIGLKESQVAASVKLTGPGGEFAPGSKAGPILVETNQPTANLTVTPGLPVVDAKGAAVDLSAVPNGTELFVQIPADADGGEVVFTADVATTLVHGKVFTPQPHSNGKPAQSVVLIEINPSNANAEARLTIKPRAAVPALGTSAEFKGGGKVVPAEGGVVVDTVSYTDFTVGTEYTIKGELMDKATGTGTGITAETKFTPTEKNGTVALEFTVPAGHEGKTFVVFETAYTSADMKEVASHRDINDAAQTVTVDKPAPVVKLATQAKDKADGDQVVGADGGTVVDTVSYWGLTPGQEYTVSGELMDKATGKGTGIKAEAKFTPKEADGTIDVEFVVPAGHGGKTFVVFESLVDAHGQLVAEHHDLEDKAQTVTIEAPKPGPSPTPTPTPSKPGKPQLPKTGANAVLIGSLAGLAAAAGAAFVLVSRRRRQ